MNKVSLRKKLAFIALLALVMIVGMSKGQSFYPRLRIDQYKLLTNDYSWRSPTFSPDNQAIAFHRDNKIGVMFLSTSQIQEWTVASNIISNIQWLSASKILYPLSLENTSLSPGINEFQFWVLDITSDDSYLLDDQMFQGPINHVAISASRTKLAFKRYLDVETRQLVIEIVDLEKDYSTTVTNHLLNKDCSFSTWSHNENEVIYSCDKQIWATDIRSNTSRPMGVLPNSNDFSVSPDGKWLILASVVNDTTKIPPPFPALWTIPFRNEKYDSEYIRSIPLSTTLIYLFYSTSFKDYLTYNAGYVEWSSDSKHIVFQGSLKTKAGQGAGIWYLTFK